MSHGSLFQIHISLEGASGLFLFFYLLEFSYFELYPDCLRSQTTNGVSGKVLEVGVTNETYQLKCNVNSLYT